MTRTHAHGRGPRRLWAAIAGVAIAAGGLLVPVQSASADAGQPWMNAAQSPSSRADELLAAMTLADKVNMLHGSAGAPVPTVGYIAPIPRLHVPGITMTDGPAGVRDRVDKSTALPSPSALAAGFDPRLAEEYGSVLGGDARALGQDVVFGPGQNIQRVPVNGRNFEYFSEDPYLSGTLSGADVRGIQRHGVIATVKHYVANNQETNRKTVSANMDDRTLHEIYEKNFGVAVADGRPGAAMCSYNRINDVYACDDSETLGSLRSQLGFTGFVVSDYPATHATTSIRDGLNVELPAGVFNTLPNVRAALDKGSITMADIDARVRETLKVLFRFGLFDRDTTARGPIDQDADNAVAQRIEAQSAVLLKNDGNVLPLGSSAHDIAVIGAPAKASAQGGGSSKVNPLSMDNAYDAIVSRAGSSATVSYADGSDLGQAAATAKSAQVALVFVKDGEAEGSDRVDLSLPGNQDALVDAVAKANPHTVVVLQTGSAVLMPWLKQVEGVLQTWYPGARGGAATAQLLWGDVNPSGKLPQTWPASNTQTPVGTPAQYPGIDGETSYSEGVYVGYRWYDQHDETPLFPFGHGLSYTRFRYGDLRLRHSSGDSRDPVTVSFKITNTGDRAGAEAPQVYVGKPDTLAPTAPKELGAFGKVELAPHETKTVTLTVNPRELSYWDSGAQAFTVQDGSYPIAVGGSSASLPLHATYRVRKTDGPVRVEIAELPGVVEPGTTYTATVKVGDLSDVPLTSAALKVSAPAGWRVAPQTSHIGTVQAGRRASRTFRVTVPAGAVQGATGLAVTLSGRVAGRRMSATRTTRLNVPYASMAAAADTVGVTANGDPGPGNFDGSGYSYSAQSLAADGVTPGGTVKVGTAATVFPAQAPGTPDAVSASGQVVKVGGTGRALVVLGAAHNGAGRGTLKATFTDGTSADVPIAFADWYGNAPADLSSIVSTGQWNQPITGGKGPHDVSLYGEVRPLPAGKTLAYVTLPAVGNLSLFSVSVDDSAPPGAAAHP
ncbi:glycoside hydrolase family 3 C-terminal domain-containing protein [Actinoallomurus sp. CA-150999]|uniref:glycoside hydrolase family 3 protein n=1 Tax=Actinoallomurus sp. CA-150999 TaxID=3239887 RepID=UPI003D902E12